MSEIIQQRPNIAGLFQAGNVRGLTNHKHRRLFHSLQWRQAYQHSEFYEYTFEKETLPLETPPTIKVRQIPNGELKGLGTGTFVWPAAHILAKYFEKRFLDGSLTEKLICDIGSGTGITGFVAAILGAKVVLTDQHCILPLLSENTEALIAMDCFSSFSMADRLIVKEYEWENKTALMDHPFDYLIVSDCVLPKLYPISMLVNAIDFLMSDKTISFFSYEHRPFPEYDPRQEFQRLCELKGLRVQVIPLSEHHPVYCAEDIEIWEVSRKDSGTCSSISSSKSRCIFSTWGESKMEIPVAFDGLNLTIHQSPSQGIGGMLWPSSAVASRFILGSIFSGLIAQLNKPDGLLRAIDLGAGCGLTTIALHRRNFSVVSTDKKSLLDVLQRNISDYTAQLIDGESHSRNIVVLEFEWEKVSSPKKLDQMIPQSMLDVDLIVCSDCLYDSTSVEPLLRTLEMLSTKRCHVLLINEMRTALEEFLYCSRRRGNHEVEIKEIEVTQPDLELVRSSTEVKFAPPIRALVMTWTKTHEL